MYVITEAYIRHHLLHKSARKLLEMSEINGLSEIILRLLEKKMRYDSNFYFFCQYFVDKLLKEIACEFYFYACKIIISFFVLCRLFYDSFLIKYVAKPDINDKKK